MNKSHLSQISIRNFRGLKEFDVPRLGRVNLITGKNNSGKTSVLEALHIYAKGTGVIRSILGSRDELWLRGGQGDYFLEERAQLASTLTYLFHGRPPLNEEIPEIEIGSQSEHRRFRMRIGWLAVDEDIDPDSEDDGRIQRNYIPVKTSQLALYPDASPYLYVSSGPHIYRTPLDRLFRGMPDFLPQNSTPSQFVQANGLSQGDISQLWDAITLTDLEPEVLESLKLLVPDLERVSLVSEGDPRKGRHALVKVRNNVSPVPIGSFGDGLNRLFGLTVAMVNSGGGLFLADEIDSGLHYSVQESVWKYVFRLATHLDIQVFAITHSYDCIRAFQRVSRAHPAEGMLIRLDRKEGSDTEATLFDEPELELAADFDIEVR